MYTRLLLVFNIPHEFCRTDPRPKKDRPNQEPATRARAISETCCCLWLGSTLPYVSPIYCNCRSCTLSMIKDISGNVFGSRNKSGANGKRWSSTRAFGKPWKNILLLIRKSGRIQEIFYFSIQKPMIILTRSNAARAGSSSHRSVERWGCTATLERTAFARPGGIMRA